MNRFDKQYAIIVAYVVNLPSMKLEYGQDGINWTISIEDGRLCILTDKLADDIPQRVANYILDRVFEKAGINYP